MEEDEKRNAVNQRRPELTQARESHVRVADKGGAVLVDVRATRCNHRERVVGWRCVNEGRGLLD